MVYSVWLGAFGWGIFFIGVLAAVILFAVRRKFYPVMYLVSIATYIFTVGFIIDALNVGRNGVLILLALSAVLFISLGYYFSTKFTKEKEEFVRSIPSRI